ncbi:MAG: chorismate-binding protein [Pseudonocardia sp.]|nr:chorismate-binding protein [Pseudonocardia sp.]
MPPPALPLPPTPTLDEVLSGSPPPFALLHRPVSSDPRMVELLVGEVGAVDRLADLPLTSPGPTPEAITTPRHQVLAMVPYRQITERGFICHDDLAPLLALRVTGQTELDSDELTHRLPATPISLHDAEFDPADEAYAEIVRRVLVEEIGTGAGSNFVIHRSFTAAVTGQPVTAALTLFRRLLLDEPGAYWTFLVHTGSRTFVGASPERHVSLDAGTAVMNPISGTYRYPSGGPTLPGILEFLADRKEADELYMVVDEELKMMARFCDMGVRVIGPHLKEMGQVAHTEYLLEGRTGWDVREILRETLVAPTVTGSPLENATRILARHERSGRGYYSGILALVGHDSTGAQSLDSAILIRTADIDQHGRFAIGVGATLVRHSDPDSEVAETRAKAAGLLAAVASSDVPSSGRPMPVRPLFVMNPQVVGALEERNATLARYWLEPFADWNRPHPALVDRRLLVIDAEDTFTAMLSHQLTALGCRTRVVNHPDASADDLSNYHVVVLGPGPGDPRDGADLKIATIRRIGQALLSRRVPFLAICLGHQIISSLLGLELVRRSTPNQGVQRDIDLFGRRERVGFYNTFAARCRTDRFTPVGLGAPVHASCDSDNREVHALRGPGFASVQFHPESLLTRDGPGLLGELLAGMVRPNVERSLPRSG